VYFYEGTLLSRRAASPEWRAVHQLFHAHRKNATPVRPGRRL
jgi:hypothetical protein